jgi:hypothetical protein
MQAKALKDFWGSFYKWKLQKFPKSISGEEWQALRREDQAAYPDCL